MIAIGLIVWLILIAILGFAGTPGSFSFIMSIVIIGGVVCIAANFAIWYYQENKEKKEQIFRRENPEGFRKREQKKREKDILEWEAKWRRKHPSRNM